MVIQFPLLNDSNIAVDSITFNPPYDTDPKITWLDKAIREFNRRQAVGDDDGDDIVNNKPDGEISPLGAFSFGNKTRRNL